MSLHMGQHWYALCDRRDEDGARCRAFMLPQPVTDPSGYGAVIADRAAVYAAAQSDGWQVDPSGSEEERWLCSQHRKRPPGPVAVVELLPAGGVL